MPLFINFLPRLYLAAVAAEAAAREWQIYLSIGAGIGSGIAVSSITIYMVCAFQIKREQADPPSPIEHDSKAISRVEGVFDMTEITWLIIAQDVRRQREAAKSMIFFLIKSGAG